MRAASAGWELPHRRAPVAGRPLGGDIAMRRTHMAQLPLQQRSRHRRTSLSCCSSLLGRCSLGTAISRSGMRGEWGGVRVSIRGSVCSVGGGGAEHATATHAISSHQNERT